MNPFESFFQSLGLSFTMSKLLPYLLALLIGWLIVYMLRKKLKLPRLLKFTLYLAGMSTVFFAYFAYSPIYQGDFSNGSHAVAVRGELRVKKMELLVVTIPGCPHCAESIERMKELKSSHPEVAIKYVVCHTNPVATEEYAKMAENRFPVQLAKHPEAMMEAAGHGFPAYLLTDGKTAKVWSNNDFGVRALDEVVDAF